MRRGVSDFGKKPLTAAIGTLSTKINVAALHLSSNVQPNAHTINPITYAKLMKLHCTYLLGKYIVHPRTYKNK